MIFTEKTQTLSLKGGRKQYELRLGNNTVRPGISTTADGPSMRTYWFSVRRRSPLFEVAQHDVSRLEREPGIGEKDLRRCIHFADGLRILYMVQVHPHEKTVLRLGSIQRRPYYQ